MDHSSLDWKKLLGLLQMPLDDEGHDFILLNGRDGNFCYSQGTTLEHDPRNSAWSTDVGHYIIFNSNNVIDYQWETLEPIKHSRTEVEHDIEGFYTSLKRKRPLRANSVVAFSVGILQRIRNATGDEADAMNSLRLLLTMFASISDGVDRNSLDYSAWGLNDATKTVVGLLPKNEWEEAIDHIQKGRAELKLKLDVPLMLRHASGPLFEEAHRQAIISAQLSMFGLPSPSKSKGGTKGFGVHYTPPYLVRSLVEESLLAFSIEGRDKIKVLDPACGSGEFLKEVVKQLRLHQYHGKIELIGWDISDIAVDMARFNLCSLKDPNLDLAVEVRNALEHGAHWPNDVDLLLMNPPFVSHESMDSMQQEQVKAILGSAYSKRPDMSSAFILKAAQSLKPNGVLGCVTPSSLLSGESHAQLRSEISEEYKLRPTLIAKLGSQSIFAGAIVETALYVAIKGESKLTPIAVWTDHKLDSTSSALRNLRKYRGVSEWSSDVITKPNYSIYPLSEGNGLSAGWEPRPYFAFELASRLTTHLKVSELYSINQGIRTGLNRAFLLKIDKVQQLRKEEHQYFRHAVVNESIQEGVLLPSVFCFYPYGEGLAISSEKQLRKALPQYYEEYLLPHKEELSSRSHSESRNWWELTRYRAWHLPFRPKIVSTSWGTAGSFAYDDKGLYVVVQGHAWTPLNNSGITANHSLALLALLTAPSLNDVLPLVSTQVQGGQWDLSAKFLSRMPIPDLQTLDNQRFLELSEFGKAIKEAESYDAQKLDDLFRNVYQELPQIILR